MMHKKTKRLNSFVIQKINILYQLNAKHKSKNLKPFSEEYKLI